jgi:hypothetical protein
MAQQHRRDERQLGQAERDADPLDPPVAAGEGQGDQEGGCDRDGYPPGDAEALARGAQQVGRQTVSTRG